MGCATSSSSSKIESPIVQHTVTQCNEKNQYQLPTESDITRNPSNSEKLEDPERLLSNSRAKQKIQYQKGELIDKGAFGSVYQGLDINTGQLLAIKTVKVSADREKVVQQIKDLQLARR